MNKISKILLMAAGALALFSASAQAATFTWNTDDPVVLGTPTADFTSGSVTEGATGDVMFERSTPWGNDTDTYTAVGLNGLARYDLSSSDNSVSFLWGSVDTYNTISFYLGNSLVDSLTGVDVLDVIGGLSGSSTININIMADGAFDNIIFESAGNSFEFANLQVSAVPLPAALPLYGAGVALLGFMGWRQRRNAA